MDKLAIDPLKVEYRSVNDLLPYARNARAHSDEQVAQVAASIKEFGFNNPILIDSAGMVIAGHCRLLAAQRHLDIDEVPVIQLDHLSDNERRAYTLADNKLALNSVWDNEMLMLEISDLEMSEDVRLNTLGFSEEELEAILSGDNLSDLDKDNTYTQHIESPIYEPDGDMPPVNTLYDRSEADSLKEKIDKADLSDEVREFLLLAATRYIKFDFAHIANYYAHASEEVQALMEDLALVIIDFNEAIEKGFVRLNERMDAAFHKDYPDAQ